MHSSDVTQQIDQLQLPDGGRGVVAHAPVHSHVSMAHDRSCRRRSLKGSAIPASRRAHGTFISPTLQNELSNFDLPTEGGRWDVPSTIPYIQLRRYRSVPLVFVQNTFHTAE